MSLEKILAEEAELEKQMFGDEPSSEPITIPEAGLEDPDDSYVDDEPTGAEGFPESTTVITQEVQETETESKQRVSWKQRFKNYKASTDKTTYNLRKENTSLSERLLQLEKENRQLKVDVSNIRNSHTDIFQGIITPEDSETIGEEAVDIVKRTSQKAVEASVAPLRDVIKRLEAEKEEDRVKQIRLREQSEYNIFLQDLSKSVPDYEVVDKDSRFSTYLEGFDESTGEKRMEVFKRAEQYRDADRVADFFLDFKRTLPRRKREVLEENITPTGTSAAGSIPQHKPEETFTSKQVEDFFNDVTRGVYRNRTKEADAIEARITKAYMEGRIR